MEVVQSSTFAFIHHKTKIYLCKIYLLIYQTADSYKYGGFFFLGGIVLFHSQTQCKNMVSLPANSWHQFYLRILDYYMDIMITARIYKLNLTGLLLSIDGIVIIHILRQGHFVKLHVCGINLFKVWYTLI